MCYILHIESATKTCSVALSQNGSGLLCVEEHSDQYIHGEKLAVFIDDIMKRASIAPENLSAISISSGPGSYTGLRIGFSLAKGMCYALSIPLISIDTLQAYESGARNYFSDSVICVMLDARRMEVYSTIFDKNGVIIKPLSSDILTEEANFTQAFLLLRYCSWVLVLEGTGAPNPPYWFDCRKLICSPTKPSISSPIILPVITLNSI